MDPQAFIESIRDRDEQIDALREYALALEWKLKEKRAGEAEEVAFSEADRELDALRYEHGLRCGSLTLR